jgi:hypothetical protein
MVSWGNETYVFKETKLFVFYGTSTDATGGAVFNYRTIHLAERLTDAAGNGDTVVAGTDGVYFSTTGGIWRTTGGPPDLISGDIHLAFNSTDLNTISNDLVVSGTAAPKLSWARDRLYARYSDAALFTQRVFVWDRRGDYWMAWTLNATNFIQSTLAGPDEDIFFGSGTDVWQLDRSLNTDNSAARTGTYVSGFSDLGSPDHRKVIREATVDGTGDGETVTFGVTTDWSTTPATTSTLAFGDVAPAFGRHWHRVSSRGAVFGFSLSGTGEWRATRVTLNARASDDFA